MIATFPVLGMRFCPTDEELITHYLRNKIVGNTLPPSEGIIIERDIYGENAAPWQLFKDDDRDLPWQLVVDSVGKLVDRELVLYVFTRLTAVGKIGKKMKNRVAGCGSWHGNNSSDYVYDGNGNKIGNRKNFKFRHNNKEAATEWNMHEYSLLDCDDYVLCKIKRIESAEAVEARKRMRANGMFESTEDEVQRFSKKTRSDDTATLSEVHGMNEGMNTGALQDIGSAPTTSEEANSAIGDDGFLGNVGSDKNQCTVDHMGYSSSAEDDALIHNFINDNTDMAAFLDEYLDCS